MRRADCATGPGGRKATCQKNPVVMEPRRARRTRRQCKGGTTKVPTRQRRKLRRARQTRRTVHSGTTKDAKSAKAMQDGCEIIFGELPALRRSTSYSHAYVACVHFLRALPVLRSPHALSPRSPRPPRFNSCAAFHPRITPQCSVRRRRCLLYRLCPPQGRLRGAGWRLRDSGRAGRRCSYRPR